jgi:hypothetical protein
MGLIGFPKTNYQSTLCNIPEEENSCCIVVNFISTMVLLKRELYKNNGTVTVI